MANFKKGVKLEEVLNANPHADAVIQFLRSVGNTCEPVWLSAGWDCFAFCLSDGLVCRIPTNAVAQRKLTREPNTIDMFRQHTNVRMPNIRIFEIPSCMFAIHEEIRGSQLSGLVTGQSGNDVGSQFIEELVGFCKDLHGSAEHIQISNFESRPSLEDRVERLFAAYRSSPQEHLLRSALRTFERTPAQTCPGHFDLNPTNVIVDLGRNVLAGIIDFQDAGVGEPAEDISKVFKTSISAGIDAARLYSRGDGGFIARAGAYALLEALEDRLDPRFRPSDRDYLVELGGLVD